VVHDGRIPRRHVVAGDEGVLLELGVDGEAAVLVGLGQLGPLRAGHDARRGDRAAVGDARPLGSHEGHARPLDARPQRPALQHLELAGRQRLLVLELAAAAVVGDEVRRHDPGLGDRADGRRHAAGDLEAVERERRDAASLVALHALGVEDGGDVAPVGELARRLGRLVAARDEQKGGERES
jgi:hypothetical protein